MSGGELLDGDDPVQARAARRLEDELIVWLTTVSGDGQPHTSPVWFLWDGSTFLVYSRPETPKVRNVAARPRVALNLDGNGWGGDIVTFEGTARLAKGHPPADRVPAYLEKYRERIAALGSDPERFGRSYSAAIEILPTRTRIW